MTDRIRVLVVDDSPSVCRVLAGLLQSAPDVAVISTLSSGEAAVEGVLSLEPDVVTLDLEMPGIGGLAALERIMARRPTPVILLSGVSGQAVANTVEGLARGAVDFVTKYTPGQNTDPTELGRELVAKVRAAARARVGRSVRRTDAARAVPMTSASAGPAAPAALVIGASTGGPAAIQELLDWLPPSLLAGVLIVQHLPSRFTTTLAALLTRQTGIAVREAIDGDRLVAGNVLVAPGGKQLRFCRGGTVRLDDGPKVNGHRPSIDVAMESAAAAFGPLTAGALLSGMGEDGAQGLAAIRNAGGRTFAQDEESCAVYGMPLRALEIGAVCEIDTPAGIARRLIGEAIHT